MPESNGHDAKPVSTGGTNGAPANGGNKLATVIAGAKATQARAVEEIKETIKAPEKTDVWKSILRVKHDETPRSRALGVLSNAVHSASSATCFCISIRPRSIAMRWPTTIPGAWAA
ncbi:fragment of cytochrome b6f complex, cytochrome b6 subunit 1 [Candidatus Sulfopaludibacter sp. SbA3]|nr:fragment of cytochrome b6f complex, cytochrome b6 subunit 1 [Candidatus Sulfopaludibacter sp. SbA3]